MSTYVISDLHGHFDLYQKMLRGIDFKESDTLYVLGDVCDRGDQAVEIYLDMMRHKNMIPFMGNHDLRMVSLLKKYGKISLRDEERLAKTNEEWNNWLRDGGIATISAFNNLDEYTRTSILSYVEGFKVCKRVRVGNNIFFLSHTAPEKRFFENHESLSSLDFLFSFPEYEKRY